MAAGRHCKMRISMPERYECKRAFACHKFDSAKARFAFMGSGAVKMRIRMPVAKQCKGAIYIYAEWRCKNAKSEPLLSDSVNAHSHVSGAAR